MKKSNISSNIVVSVIGIGLFFTGTYLMTRIAIFFLSPFPWYEKLIGYLLLLAEFFIVIHSIGYAIEILRVAVFRKQLVPEKRKVPKLTNYPPVVVIVPSYKEPIEILESTLRSCFNLTYPNLQMLLLDDTNYEDEPGLENYREEIDKLCERFQMGVFRRKWRGAKAGIINDYLAYIDNKPLEGSGLIDYSKTHQYENPEFLCIFDADQNPFPNFVEPLVERMLNNKRLAFLQTPQYYTNYEHNRVARASGLQQVIFYEYICEGKSLKDAMFCCGTNVMFRIEALKDVGGFDESTVTEDFATSLNFHLRGWSSDYYDRVGAFGMGPEDLGGYFKQQFRWAFGTLTLFKKIVKELFKNPKKMPMVKWWEFMLSGTHYFIGFIYLIILLAPIIYIIFGIPSYFADYNIYLLMFIPYFIITLTSFFWTLRQRGYSPFDMLMGQYLIVVTFPIYMKAAVYAMFNIKKKFVITPKGGAKKLSIIEIWPQVLITTLMYVAVVWGILRAIYEGNPLAAFLVNTFWCTYNFFILSSIYYFNNPVEESDT